MGFAGLLNPSSTPTDNHQSQLLALAAYRTSMQSEATIPVGTRQPRLSSTISIYRRVRMDNDNERARRREDFHAALRFDGEHRSAGMGWKECSDPMQC
jgi:hypothetical protein